MSAPSQAAPKAAPDGDDASIHTPYVPDSARIPEFTWPALVSGALLGILFGASSLYLVLKVGLTVSASIPVAVLSITLFRAFSQIFKTRQATILENNIVQTAGSAGESIAFGLGVTMPALLLLGYDMDVVRVMTVGALGGLLGILMMIPLRRAFIVKQRKELTYPEGTACADVLIAGEQGGATALTVFAGFGVAFLHKFLYSAMKLWKESPTTALYTRDGKGLVGGEFGGELSPELLGVGYIIGPRIASIMLAGGVLASLVIAPTMVLFASHQSVPLEPAKKLISEMDSGEIHKAYVLYVGAGAVATGGIISLLQIIPLIFASARSGLRDFLAERKSTTLKEPRRTERDLPQSVTWLGSLGLIAVMTLIPALGLGLNFYGIVGAALIVGLGFLFVTVSARLTGQIGSSSNPISGMTIATLLVTCLVFVLLKHTDKAATLMAMSIAGIVCVAASNGGTTAQDLKTGFLVGATPRWQQLSILVGALTSALVIGLVLLALNRGGTVYSSKPENLPDITIKDVAAFTQMESPGGDHADDTKLYHVVNLAEGEIEGAPQGRYLVNDAGKFCYLVDPAINGRLKETDSGVEAKKFEAPKTRLMAIIIDGIMSRRLPWGLVLIGVLTAVCLELAGIQSLPFAVGMYLPIQSSTPIFIGGVLRWALDKWNKRSAAESEMSPGVLASSGYIAGGSIAGVLVAFLTFAPKLNEKLQVGLSLPTEWQESNWPAIVVFSLLVLFLALVGSGKLFGEAKE